MDGSVGNGSVEVFDGLGRCVFCIDVDVSFRGRLLFRSGTTVEVAMSLKGAKEENILYFQVEKLDFMCPSRLVGDSRFISHFRGWWPNVAVISVPSM
ncbi:hypothetical protein TNCV_802221 [Trichonephila clavipes]|nr:hypothetical protein TNCV_802221 [Trichonephila clavipes]